MKFVNFVENCQAMTIKNPLGDGPLLLARPRPSSVTGHQWEWNHDIIKLALVTCRVKIIENYKKNIKKMTPLPLIFDIFEKKFLESLQKQKCSSHTKKNYHRISGFRDYSIIQPASQSVTDHPLYISRIWAPIVWLRFS